MMTWMCSFVFLLLGRWFQTGGEVGPCKEKLYLFRLEVETSSSATDVQIPYCLAGFCDVLDA